MKTIYDQYVHEYTDEKGNTKYVVAAWDTEAGQYTRPLRAYVRKLTGCFAEYSRTLKGLGEGFATKREALRRARYLYSGQEDWQ